MEIRRTKDAKAVTWREAEEAINAVERQLREEEEEAMREAEANKTERFEHREALLLEQQLQEELAPDSEYEEDCEYEEAHFCEA